eukprot:m.297970 g.297970  ORF g.297970 m.297970 type:complete len:460 (+) comp13750_c0_seq1:384-1763(+)
MSFVKRIQCAWHFPALPTRELEEEFGLRPSSPALRRKHQDAFPATAPTDPTSACLNLSGSMLLLMAVAIAAIVLCREYLGAFLSWIVHLPEPWNYVFYAALFIVVSMPMTWGYIVLNLGAGYLFGMKTGLLVASLGATTGSMVAFVLCRRFFKEYIQSTLHSYENFRQILRVIEGRQGFRIILMTRLTPVPFGLQNALFSSARISFRRYFCATLLGLLPTQSLNAYVGTTLRSMEDVLSGKNSNTIVLFSQIGVAFALTWFVNQRMKREVHNACEMETQRVREKNLQSLPHYNIPYTDAGGLHASVSVSNFKTLTEPNSPTLYTVIPMEMVEEEEASVFSDDVQAPLLEPEPRVHVDVSSPPRVGGSVRFAPGATPKRSHSTRVARPATPDDLSAEEMDVMPSPVPSLKFDTLSPHKGPTTRHGQIVRGHRRSHSAGPVLAAQIRKERNQIIKIGNPNP